MNVLSLFDGMSCGQLALQRAGIKVTNYFASEIDTHAIKVTQTNFPNTIQLGSVTHEDGKACTLSSSRTESKVNVLLNNASIRRLTPIECERLQTVPDNYTAGVSDTQRYKMLGNGWTVDVITHILKFIQYA